MRSRAPISVIRGPLGSGKTFGAIQRLLLQMCEQQPYERNGRMERRTRWLAVRNTYLDLSETTIKDFLAVFRDGEMGRMHWGGSEPPQFDVTMRLEDGTHVIAEVIFLALDRPDAVRKLKGYQVTGVWFNELSEINKILFDMADLRHGRFSEMQGGGPATWHGMLGDTNSYDSSHWLYKLEKAPPEGWEFFAQPGGVVATGELTAEGRKLWRVNPNAENVSRLPDGYYERGLQGKEDDWISVMLANEFGFTVSGKAVHPRFIHSRHVAQKGLKYEPRYPLLLGLDFGRTPAAVIFQDLTHIGRYLVLAEFCTQDMSAALFAPELYRMIRKRWPDAEVRGWGDPAGDAAGQATEDTPLLICRAAGLPVQAAPSNVPALRRAAVDNPLVRSCMDGGPALLVDPQCETLIKGMMGGYHYRQLQVSGPEPRYSDSPEKNFYSHVCFSSGTRIAVPGGEVAIETLRVGDLVETPIGPRPVAFVGAREAARQRLKFSSGAEFTCTNDHPIMSLHGRWVSADAVEYSDLLLTRLTPVWTQRLCLRFARGRSIRSSSFWASATTRDRPAAITNRTTRTAIVICTAWFGLTRMVRSLVDTTSTTATGLRPTTGSRTSSAFFAMRTTASTCAHPTAWPTRSEPSGRLSLLRSSGAGSILAWLERSGFGVAQGSRVYGRDSARSRRPASAADLSTECTNWKPSERDSAPSLASRPRGSSRALMMSQWIASRVASRSRRIAIGRERLVRLVARECLSAGIVHNIEVADAHCYYAEGILVSNCEALEYGLGGAGEGREALRPPEHMRRPWPEQREYDPLNHL